MKCQQSTRNSLQSYGAVCADLSQVPRGEIVVEFGAWFVRSGPGIAVTWTAFFREPAIGAQPNISA